MSTSTRVSSIQCEGNHGELLKLTSKHTILLPAGVTEAAVASKGERAPSVLPPSNALISLILQVRVDRKLVPVHDLQRSGLLETIVSFLSKYGTRLRIKAVLDPEVDQSLLEVPILLEPFPSPLTLNFGTSVSHLTNLAFSLHFYTPSITGTSPLSIRNDLTSNKLSASSSSLVFRSMIKCFSSLAARYPLVFDLRWLDYLQNHNTHLPSIAKSLRRLSQKVQTDSHSNILQKCLTRLRQRTTTIESISTAAPSQDLASQIETFPPPQVTHAFEKDAFAVKDAFFNLLLNSAKRKHAVTKLVLPELHDGTAPDATLGEKGAQELQALDCGKADNRQLPESKSHILHEYADTSSTACCPVVDNGDVLLSSTLSDLLNAVNSSLDDHTIQALPILCSNTLPDNLFQPHSADLPHSCDLWPDIFDDVDWNLGAMKLPELSDIAAQVSTTSFQDLTSALGQLETMIGQHSPSDDNDEERLFLGSINKVNIALDDADMIIDSPKDCLVEGIYIASDEFQLDELDSKMSVLSEQADLDTVDRRMKALLEV